MKFRILNIIFIIIFLSFYSCTSTCKNSDSCHRKGERIKQHDKKDATKKRAYANDTHRFNF